jgi:hypothetical protein
VRLEILANQDQAIYRTELFRRLEQQETNHGERHDGR